MAGNGLIKLLRCNSTTRTNSTEILLNGQPLVEQDTHLLYVGDGVTEAKNLTPYGGGAQLEDNCVLYSKVQNLTEEQKAQARENIGVDSGSTDKKYRHQLFIRAYDGTFDDSYSVSFVAELPFSTNLSISAENTSANRTNWQNLCNTMSGKSYVCFGNASTNYFRDILYVKFLSYGFMFYVYSGASGDSFSLSNLKLESSIVVDYVEEV